MLRWSYRARLLIDSIVLTAVVSGLCRTTRPDVITILVLVLPFVVAEILDDARGLVRERQRDS